MVRFPHNLKPTKTDKIPQDWIFLSTQTSQKKIAQDKIEHSLNVGYAQSCAYDADDGFTPRQDIVYTDINGFWDWVIVAIADTPTTHMIAYNVIVSMIALDGFEELEKRGWTFDGFFSRELTSVFRWKKGDQRIKIMDLGNIYNVTRSEWLAEVKTNLALIDFENATDQQYREIAIAAVETAKYLMLQWFSFLRDNGCGSFKPTVSATAFNTWRRRFIRHRVHIHDNQDAIDLERDAYHGGRSECLFVGTPPPGKYYYLDVNAMYGHVLANYWYPASLWGFDDQCNMYRLRYKLDRYAVVAEVGLRLTDNPFPYKILHHTSYPLGEITTVLTTPELELALENDWIVDVGRIAWYRKYPLFSEYAKYFRKLRTQYEDSGNETMVGITKLLLNGLYGKFGQHGFSQEKMGKCDPGIYRREQVYDIEDKKYFDQVWLGGTIFRERREGEGFNSFPAVAAHVTAYARLYLYNLMKMVPKGHLFYVDTDSLIVDQVGKDALRYYLNEHEMGMLKIETESDWLTIEGVKRYEMQHRTRMGGLGENANPLGRNRYEQWNWPKMRGLLQRGMSGEYTINKVVKHYSSKVWSGRQTESGWVDPFIFVAGELYDSVPHYHPPAAEK